MHRILIGARREDFVEEVHECDTSSRQGIRDSVDSFRQFSTKTDVLLVNTAGWFHEDWGLFLKVLEDGDCRGHMWFYGGSLLNYPPTIRSRCVVEGKTFNLESKAIKEFLKENDAEQFAADFEKLKAYNLILAWGMLKSKGRFIAFMYGLDTAGRENFHTLFSNLIEMNSREYLFLFQEWLQENPIFSSSELKVCGFLRGGNFEKLLLRYLGTSSFLLENYLFPFLIIYKLIRST